MMSNDKLMQFVNQSGFPLQIGVAHLINSHNDAHGWRVLYQEHAWRTPDHQRDGFIDLVLKNEEREIFLVIECKRVMDSVWIFLIEDSRQLNRRHAKLLKTMYYESDVRYFGWKEVSLSPESPESYYCVVPGQDNKAKPIIERLAAEVVVSTEAIAEEQMQLIRRSATTCSFYASVLVTTAKLKVCFVNPNHIDTHSGTLNDAHFDDVPYVRFRKQLSTNRLEVGHLDTSTELVRRRERSVFVVNTHDIISFLENFEVDASHYWG